MDTYGLLAFLQYTSSYPPMLAWAGVSYLIILAIIQVMIPRIRLVKS